MNDDKEVRAEFEAWYHRQYIDSAPLIWAENVQAYRDFDHNQLFGAYQAGRAALQSQDREDAERYRWWRTYFFSECTEMIYHMALAETQYDFDAVIDHARRTEGERN